MATRRGKKLDLNLDLFMRNRDPMRSYNYREIAEAVGCTYQNIQRIERIALRKLRREAIRRGLLS